MSQTLCSLLIHCAFHKKASAQRSIKTTVVQANKHESAYCMIA